MKMLDALDKNENPTIYGDGSEAFDFVAVKDCALANICAMKASATDKFYNVGTGLRTSLKELAETLIELTNSKCEINYVKKNQTTFVRNRVGSTEKAKKEIGYSSKINLKMGLEQLIDWRNNDKLAPNFLN